MHTHMRMLELECSYNSQAGRVGDSGWGETFANNTVLLLRGIPVSDLFPCG